MVLTYFLAWQSDGWYGIELIQREECEEPAKLASRAIEVSGASDGRACLSLQPNSGRVASWTRHRTVRVPQPVTGTNAYGELPSPGQKCSSIEHKGALFC